MIPTNTTRGSGGSPISSNTVIWQGRDIECIHICNGDSVTDVTFKLATELCKIMDELKLTSYDLTCFNPICPTLENFHDLIQFLITQVCKIENCVFTPGCDPTCKEPVVNSDCPDKCLVNLAPCFQYTNPLGDVVLTMPLNDYVYAIGIKLCQIIAELTNDSARLGVIEPVVASNSNRIGAVENALPSAIVTLPTSCLMGLGPWAIGPFVQNLETAFCALQAATGTPAKLLSSIGKECINLDQSASLANHSINMGALTGWVNQAQYSTVADSLNNMWMTICDIRAAVLNIQSTCCCDGCDDIIVSFTASVTGSSLSLFFTGSAPVGITDCFPGGDFVTITDANGGVLNTYVPVITNLNGSAVINLTGTPVNPALALTIVIQGCWTRPEPGASCGGLKCERVLTYVLNACAAPTNVSVSHGIQS